ncbi:MAG: archaetidylserine decarboxylase [Verrucomicrobiota bacterium]
MSKIYVYNRKSSQVEEEQVFNNTAMEFFHENPFGFWLMETFLRNKWATERYASYYHSKKSKKDIHEFIDQYQIDMAEVDQPMSSFECFNDFFIRKLKPSARPVDHDSKVLISPADARLFVYKVSEDKVIPVKGKNFKLSELVKSSSAIEPFINGLCLVFRLAPIDYHRFCYVDKGTVKEHISVPGSYRAVNPMSLAKMKPVFSENRREYCILETENFGKVLHIDVGAIGVGKIVQNHPEGGTFAKGDEKGYFEFGGSTSILFLQPGVVEMDSDIVEQSKNGIETLVRYGERIGAKV